MDWDASLETGFGTIDRQHREIVATFNELVDAYSGEHDSTLVGDVLVRLSDYVSTHFAEEEALMVRCGFPEELASAHRGEHLEMAERTRAMVIAHRSGQGTSVPALAGWLQEWLVRHVLAIDGILANHIRANAPESAG